MDYKHDNLGPLIPHRREEVMRYLNNFPSNVSIILVFRPKRQESPAIEYRSL